MKVSIDTKKLENSCNTPSVERMHELDSAPGVLILADNASLTSSFVEV